MRTTEPGARQRPRRRLLLAGVLATAMVVAACGDDDDGDGGASQTTAAPATTGASTGGGASTTAAAQPDDVDPEGVLRIALDMTSAGGLDLDPIEYDSPTEYHVHYNIYDTLLRQKEDGSYGPGLAKEARIVDPNTIEVELQEGVKFQDGTDLDAEAVKFSIERIKDTNKVQSFRMAELSQVASIDVVDPLNLVIRLSSPIAGSFYNLLAHNETLVVSPTAVRNGVNLNENPVGAGPFKLVSFQREALLKLEKWDGYFQADQVKLAGIEYVQTSAATVVTALRSHAVDVASLTHDAATQLQGAGLEVRDEASPNSVLWVSMQCSAYPELQDVRVRQALNFATDKEAMNEAMFGGLGEPMSQMWTSDSPYYNPDLADDYPHDPERARQLLAEAGHPELELTMATLPGPLQRAAELLQAQWAEAGVRLSLQPLTNVIQEYYLDKKMATFPTTQTRMWTDKITRNFAPGSTGYTCPVEDQAFKDKLMELRGYGPDDPKAVTAWQELSKMASDQALGVWGSMGTVAVAWDGDRVGNPTFRPSQLGTFWPDVFNIYVKS